MHHDNADPHQAFMVKKFLVHNGTAVLEQPPYSPDLAPCNFWLFDKLMRGDHLDTIEAIKQESSQILNAILEIEFQQCFDLWRQRWRECMAEGGRVFQRGPFSFVRIIA